MSPLDEGEEAGLRVWPSITDLALSTSLLILLYVAAQFALSYESTALALEMDERRRLLAQEILAAVPEAQRAAVTITADGNLQRIAFADQLLFDSGKATLKDTGKVVLTKVWRVLLRQSRLFERVQIEGHTDDQALGPRSPFPSNWELSSARATSVVRFLEGQSPKEAGLLSATGYSQFHPVDVSESDAARARNRRVELVVVYSPQSILDEVLKDGAKTAPQESAKP